MDNPNVTKQFLKLDGKPIIVYTLELFLHHPTIDAIVVVCVASWMSRLKECPEETKRIIVDGTRQVLDFAKSCGVKFMVYLSSMEVYGEIRMTALP